MCLMIMTRVDDIKQCLTTVKISTVIMIDHMEACIIMTI